MYLSLPIHTFQLTTCCHSFHSRYPSVANIIRAFKSDPTEASRFANVSITQQPLHRDPDLKALDHRCPFVLSRRLSALSLYAERRRDATLFQIISDFSLDNRRKTNDLSDLSIDRRGRRTYQLTFFLPVRAGLLPKSALTLFCYQ